MTFIGSKKTSIDREKVGERRRKTRCPELIERAQKKQEEADKEKNERKR